MAFEEPVSAMCAGEEGASHLIPERDHLALKQPVIASEAKQSRTATEPLDCFVAALLAMTVQAKVIPTREGGVRHSYQIRTRCSGGK
jgi:hypothetical protein